MLTSNVALKEWASVVEALASGDQLLLVRKGGVRDTGGTFQLEHREFLLYPTWEHQRQTALRAEFQQRFRGLLSQPEHPTQMSLQVYGGVAATGRLKEPAALADLRRYHIWTQAFLEERVRYRSDLPTVVVVLRAYRLDPPVLHPVAPEYAGCKSWVRLKRAIPVEGLEPVVDNRRFRTALREITARLE